LADDLELMDWLENHIFPAEQKLTKEIVYDATLLSIAEMIKSGTTSFCDMYLFAQDVARAVNDAGMRCWLGEALYDFPSPNYGELANGFSYMKDLFADYKHHPLITITVDPHSTYTCSPTLLTQLKDFARQQESLLVIHLAENRNELEMVKKMHGCSPIEHLENLHILDQNTLAAHCVQVTEQDIALLAQKEIKIAHCPQSNMKLASGIAPVAAMLKQDITVSLGTDGSASNNSVDMFAEMSMAAKLQKVATYDPTVMNAETTLQAATISGAKALHAAHKIGRLEIGMQADMIVLNLNQPHLTPLFNIPSHLVYAARGSDIIHSIINGKLVMENRQILTFDEQEIMAKMATR
jgi:5-methylthioadenosine/S-adenosylhomocysteine deaminase